MRLFMQERKATDAEIASWLKGKLTTSRIHDFGEKYPVSYDWLLCGDLKGLLRMVQGNPHGAPSPLPQRPVLSSDEFAAKLACLDDDGRRYITEYVNLLLATRALDIATSRAASLHAGRPGLNL
jgi:hypothetical protein